MLALVKSSIFLSHHLDRYKRLMLTSHPVHRFLESMDNKISASRCKENSIDTLVLAPGLPTCQTLSSLDIVEKSHQSHFSLSVASEEKWSLGNASKGFNLDQALRKETLR